MTDDSLPDDQAPELEKSESDESNGIMEYPPN